MSNAEKVYAALGGPNFKASLEKALQVTFPDANLVGTWELSLAIARSGVGGFSSGPQVTITLPPAGDQELLVSIRRDDRSVAVQPGRRDDE